MTHLKHTIGGLIMFIGLAIILKPYLSTMQIVGVSIATVGLLIITEKD